MKRSVLGVVADYAELSHPGLDPTKQLNEDSCGVSDTPLGLLAVLCDGMGGHSSGEVASRTAVATVLERFAEAPADADAVKVLHLALEAANEAVCDIDKTRPQVGRPGSTCVAALLTPLGLRVAHVGDSRAYHVRRGQIQRLTRDHSVVGELLAAGAITPEQAAHHPNAHHITRALGMHDKVVVDVSGLLPLEQGDLVITCSDGLTDLMSDPEILARAQGEAAAVARRLVELALERGGHDNVTVQCLRVLEAPDNAPTIVDTRVDSGLETPGPTIARGPEAPPATVVDNRTQPTPAMPPERLKVPPTMVDHGDRATPIAPFPPTGPHGTLPAAPPLGQKPLPSLPPDVPPPRRGNPLMLSSVALVAAILVFLLLWWIARALG